MSYNKELQREKKEIKTKKSKTTYTSIVHVFLLDFFVGLFVVHYIRTNITNVGSIYLKSSYGQTYSVPFEISQKCTKTMKDLKNKENYNLQNPFKSLNVENTFMKPKLPSRMQMSFIANQIN